MEKDFVEFDRDKLTITVHLEDGSTLVVGKDDVKMTAFSGGPGGQNVNKNMNGVRLTYHIPEERRSNAKKTRELVTKSIRQRKREQNVTQAFEQLADKIRRYFEVKPERKETKTPKKEKEKRLKDKKMQSQKKTVSQKSFR
jgi:ribosome-associated protein